MGNDLSKEENKSIAGKQLDADYVEKAEEVIKEKILLYEDGHIRAKKAVTTTKVRNLYSLANDICNSERYRKEDTLLPESKAKLKQMYVRIIFEYKRDKETKKFIREAKLLQYIKGIGDDRESLVRFTLYMEALVAFHRYYGGKEV